MSVVVARLKWILLGVVPMAMAGCGGGDSAGSAPASPPSPTDSVIELRVIPGLPSTVSGGDEIFIQVRAVHASGAQTDVTETVAVETDTPNRVQAQATSGSMRLSYANVAGPLRVTLRAAGRSFSQETTVALSTLRLTVSDGHSPMAKAYGTNHFVSIVGRELMLTVFKQRPTDYTSVTQSAVITSSDPNVLSVQPVVDPNGNIPWFVGFVNGPGTVDLTATVGDITTTERVVIPKALVVGAPNTYAIGITEGPAGRVTSFFVATPRVGDFAASRVVFSSSVADNEWSELTVLQPPNSTGPNAPYGHIHGAVKAAEGSNGHRAVVSVSNLGRAWVHLIDPSGQVRGPLDVAADLGEQNFPLAIAVEANGDAHVWLLRPEVGIRRIFVEAATLSSRVINTTPAPNIPPSQFLDVSIHTRGTVAMAWFESNCVVRYAFDRLQLTSASSNPSSQSFALPNCDANFYAPGISVAAGNASQLLAVRVPTGFNTTEVRLISAPLTGTPMSTLLDSDRGETAMSLPRVATDDSGASMVLWQTTDRGVWARYEAAGAALGAPFLVEAPFFTLATRTVDNVYPRGDGRFLLAWTGGSSSERNRLEFREYSPAQGLAARQSMPYEVFGASNTTKLLVSPRGLSVVWSYGIGLDWSFTTAVQGFLP